MRTRAVVGADVGTTSVKAVVLDEAGGLLARGSSPPIETRRPSRGAAEQDAEEVWAGVVAAVRGALDTMPVGVDVAALAVAAQSGSVVGLDEAGAAVTPVITWMDRRAEPVVRRWTDESLAARIRAVTGWRPAPGLGLAILASTRLDAVMVGGVDALVSRRLTGRWATNPTSAAGLQLMELATAEWSEELCALVGVEPSRLPVIESCGDPLGRLSSEAASEIGLSPGVLVVHGGHDQSCTAYGLALVEPGGAFLSGGTAWVLTVVADSPSLEGLPAEVSVSHHVVPGRWTRSVLLGDHGAVLAKAAAREAEGIVAAAGRRVAGALDLMGASGAELLLVGGVTAGATWPQRLADVVKHTIVAAPSPSWPAVGAARLAGLGAGLSIPVGSLPGDRYTPSAV